jgi:N-acetylneuraminic acid mutarotase
LTEGSTLTNQSCSSTYGAGTISGANVTNINIFCGPAAVGSFVSAGNLTDARANHTATLLSSGLVLVAGGANFTATNTTYPASVEIYDPSNGIWSSAGSIANPRENHTATLLPNGKVLIAGGFIISGSNPVYLSSAELYDPTSNTWSSAGNMVTARDNHTATLLSNGNVLVAGGLNSGGALASSELYNPTTNSWSSAGNLSSARYSHTSILLPNGNVLVAGGLGISTLLVSAELYCPTNNTWTATGSLSTARMLHTATLLPNGSVLVSGGEGSGFIASAELYSPTSGTWSSAGSMSTARYGHTAILLPTGNVLIAGGSSDGVSTLSSAELYDPSSNAWSLTGSLNTARYLHTSTMLSNGEVLLVGGLGATASLTSAELYW